jgi:hypothetical protein
MTGGAGGVSSAIAIAVAIAVLALAIVAQEADAAATRAEYVAQVDPICQAGRAREKAAARSFKKRVRLLKERGVDLDEPTKRGNRLVVAFYDRIARIYKNVDGQISAVVPAPGDEAIISEWLKRRERPPDLLERAVHAFARGKEKRSSQLFTKAFRAGLFSQIPVQDFGFKSCVEIDPGP